MGTSRPSTSEPRQAPLQASTSAQQTSPVPASTSVPAGPTGNCGDCVGCLWGSGVCYPDADADYCGSWPDNRWCGGSSLVQKRAGRARRGSHFLGASLIQQSAALSERVSEDVPCPCGAMLAHS